jgi:hypothetical protein
MDLYPALPDTATLTVPLHRTTLWTLRKNNRRLTAEVVSVDGHWELRLFAQGVLFLWHACAEREVAVACAGLIQQDCADDHWHR